MDLRRSENAEKAARRLGRCGRELKKAIREEERTETESFGEERETFLRTGEDIRCGKEIPEDSLRSEGPE